MTHSATKLKRVVSMRAGGTPRTSDRRLWAEDGGGTPWVVIADMSSGRPVVQTDRSVSTEGLELGRLPVGEPGTLLFAMYASVGALAQLAVRATWNQAILGMEPIDDRSDLRFVRYWLEHLRPSLSAQSRSNTQDNLNAEQVANFPFPTLEFDRQEAIADFLDVETVRIDALIAKKRRLIELTNKRFENLILYAIAGHATSADRWKDSGLAWLGPIPAHWGVPWVGANFQTQLGKMLNASAASGPEQYPYLRNTNVQWDHFEMEDLATMTFTAEDRARCALQPGDLLVCEGGEVGRAAVWHGEGTDIYFQKAIHRVRSLGNGNTRFLMYCLWAAASRKVFEVEGNQSTIVHLTGEKLREHRFPLPPRAEQDRIVRQLDSAQELTREVHANLTCQIDLLTNRRQALITAAVTGELDVARPTAEEAP